MYNTPRFWFKIQLIVLHKLKNTRLLLIMKIFYLVAGYYILYNIFFLIFSSLSKSQNHERLIMMIVHELFFSWFNFLLSHHKSVFNMYFAFSLRWFARQKKYAIWRFFFFKKEGKEMRIRIRNQFERNLWINLYI